MPISLKHKWGRWEETIGPIFSILGHHILRLVTYCVFCANFVKHSFHLGLALTSEEKLSMHISTYFAMLSATKFQISSVDQESNRSRVLQDILSQSQFLDVTLVNDDREWGAHKLILSTVSPVLRRILDRGPQHHPLLYLRGTKNHQTLKPY